jgi:hypothetical protein
VSDEPQWSEDRCTCGHLVSAHKDGEGRCDGCASNAHWHSVGSKLCTRYQWNGEPRKRLW